MLNHVTAKRRRGEIYDLLTVLVKSTSKMFMLKIGAHIINKLADEYSHM